MSRVADTSLAAYRALTPKSLTRCHRLLLAAMKPGRLYTRRELESLTLMRSGPVCGRVRELLDAVPPLIEVAGEKLCPESGKQVEALMLAPAQMALELAL